MTTEEQIRDFFAQRAIALIGASRNPKDFSRSVLHAFRRAGYIMHPVNPRPEEVREETCYANVRDVPVAVDGVLLMVPPAVIPQAIRDSLQAGVKRLWIFGAGRPQALDNDLRALCREQGATVINGFCPLMFLRGAAWPHHLHGWIARHSRLYRAVPA